MAVKKEKVNRIEVGFRKGVRDALGEKVRRRIVEHLRINVDEVRTIDVYTVEGSLSRGEVKQIAQGPLTDPVIQGYAINRGLAADFDWLIEVGFRPGVTDNVGRTATEAIRTLLGNGAGKMARVYTSRQYVIRGGIRREEAERIASGLLANELIERFEIVEGKDWDPRKGMDPYVPKVTGGEQPNVEEIDLNVSDENLLAMSSDRVLALSLPEMKAIQAYLKNPAVVAERKKVGLGERITDVELESLAQTWSEHCKH
ncbi:MAG: phosphoribosylformylglycinamidine synthase, partial [Deltaproteobacteria bacterium]|nr:phosphoribosylformylglycinamidine synthase [Deltaproteobacteria bacterium]